MCRQYLPVVVYEFTYVNKTKFRALAQHTATGIKNKEQSLLNEVFDMVYFEVAW